MRDVCWSGFVAGKATGGGVFGGVESSFSEQAFDTAIAGLAGAAFVENGWPDALRAVAQALGAQRASLLVADKSNRFYELIASDQDPAVDFGVPNYLDKPDVWARFFGQRPKDSVLITAGHEAATALCDAVAGPVEGKRQPCLVAVVNEADLQGAVIVEGVDPQWHGLSLTLLRRLHAPIRRAVQAYCVFDALKASLSVSTRLLDQMPFGVLMLDRYGRILDSNTTGDRLLLNGSILKVRGGRLSCTDPDEDMRMQAAIHDARELEASLEAADPHSSVLKIYGREGIDPWSISVSPAQDPHAAISPTWGRHRPDIVVCISDRQPITELRARQIAEAFGLSPQEEMISARLASGDTLADIAADTGRSIETLRTQLRAVFQKTEIASQPQLVKLILSAPLGPNTAPHGMPPDTTSAAAGRAERRHQALDDA